MKIKYRGCFIILAGLILLSSMIVKVLGANDNSQFGIMKTEDETVRLFFFNENNIPERPELTLFLDIKEGFSSSCLNCSTAVFGSFDFRNDNNTIYIFDILVRARNSSTGDYWHRTLTTVHTINTTNTTLTRKWYDITLFVELGINKFKIDFQQGLAYPIVPDATESLNDEDIKDYFFNNYFNNSTLDNEPINHEIYNMYYINHSAFGILYDFDPYINIDTATFQTSTDSSTKGGDIGLVVAIGSISGTAVLGAGAIARKKYKMTRE